jgi:hypothetical protein
MCQGSSVHNASPTSGYGQVEMTAEDWLAAKQSAPAEVQSAETADEPVVSGCSACLVCRKKQAIAPPDDDDST